MKKLFYHIHSTLGFFIGIIITVTCITGATLVFETEINEITKPKVYFSGKNDGEPLPLTELVAKANQQLAGSHTVMSVQIPRKTGRNYMLGLSGQGRVSACINPYTGEITGFSQRSKGFTGFMFRLHRWLLDSSRTTGKAIVGYSTLSLVFILISGAVVWWPKSRKQLNARLKVKTKNGLKRFWFDTHTTVGIYVFAGLLLLALTGLHYSFDWYRQGLYKVLGVEAPVQGGNADRRNTAPTRNRETAAGNSAENRVRENRRQGGDNSKTINIDNWDNVLAQIKNRRTTFKNITISDGSVSVVPQIKFGNSRAYDKYAFDTSTGEITNIELYKDQPAINKVRGWIYTLHVGAWGGLFSKIITCIVSLIGASLPITGYYIYSVKWRKRKSKTTAKSVNRVRP